MRIGVGRSDPKADAVRDTGAGAAGDVGVGEAAWRRRIAPRHRDAVRGFFGSEAPVGDSTTGISSPAPAPPAPTDTDKGPSPAGGDGK